MTFRCAFPVAATLCALVLSVPMFVHAAVAPAPSRRVAPPSNARLLQSAVRAVCDRLVAAAPIMPGTKIALRAEGAQPLEADVADALLQALNARHIDCVLLMPASVPDTGTAQAEPPKPTGPRGGAAPPSGSISGGGLGEFARLQAERAAQAARADSIAKATNAPAAASAPPVGASPSLLSTGAGNLPVVAFRVAEARVDYVREYHGGLFGAVRVERRATARLGLRLTNPGSDAVSWSASADTSFGDVVLRSDLGAVEDRQRPETRPVAPSSGLGKIVEPVLVVVLIAGLVSLFYQNRP